MLCIFYTSFSWVAHVISSVLGDSLTFFFGEFPLFYCPSSLDFKSCKLLNFHRTRKLCFYCTLFRALRWEVLDDVGARGTRSLRGHTGLPLPQACGSQMPLGPSLGAFCLGGLLWLLAVPTAGILLHSWSLTLVPGPEPTPPPWASCFWPVFWASS